MVVLNPPTDMRPSQRSRLQRIGYRGKSFTESYNMDKWRLSYHGIGGRYSDSLQRGASWTIHFTIRINQINRFIWKAEFWKLSGSFEQLLWAIFGSKSEMQSPLITLEELGHLMRNDDVSNKDIGEKPDGAPVLIPTPPTQDPNQLFSLPSSSVSIEISVQPTLENGHQNAGSSNQRIPTSSVSPTYTPLERSRTEPAQSLLKNCPVRRFEAERSASRGLSPMSVQTPCELCIGKMVKIHTYRLIEAIGSGTFAHVFLCVDLEHNGARHKVVKLLSKQLPDSTKVFENEHHILSVCLTFILWYQIF